MSLAQAILGSAIGITSRIVEGFQKRGRRSQEKERQQVDQAFNEEFNRRLTDEYSRRQQETQALSNEFDRRLMAEYQRRQQQGEITPDEEPIQVQTPPTTTPVQDIPSPQAMEELVSLWRMANGDIDVFRTWASQYPDVEVQYSVSDPVIFSRILQILEEIPLEPGYTEEGIPPAPISSSNVQGFSYDRQTGDLLVKFHEGGLYRYSGVPRNIFEGFANGIMPATTEGSNAYGSWWIGKTPSLGASHWQLIRDNYPYERVA